jgi:FecR protein
MKKDQHHGSEEGPMRDDYLWDGAGTPDPETQRLESLLSEFRHSGQPLTLTADLPAAAGKPVETGKLRGLLLQMPWVPRLAAAAIVLLGLGVSVFLSLRPGHLPETGPAWNVATLEGAPQIGSQTLSGSHAASKLHVGQTLITDSDSRASITENDLGEIKVDPNSRVRLLETGEHRKRMQLEVGTIHAAIWAPAGQFVVDTPSAVAVDLGCAYTLQVAPDGSGTIRTTLGWVGFHLNGRDSFIPAGAMCSTRPHSGPGIPYFEDAPPSFREAIAQFDSSARNSQGRDEALAVILSQARVRDALSLWHLLSRTDGAERTGVYDRLASLVAPPSVVTRDGILALDSHMLDLYWDALDLGDISIWRMWEQSSSPGATPLPQMPQQRQLLLKKAPAQ